MLKSRADNLPLVLKTKVKYDLQSGRNRDMVFEPRKEERQDYPHEIEYVVDPLTTYEFFKAVAVNISKSGLCLYTSTPLSEGQTITIKSTIPAPSQTAVVRWIQKLNDFYYKIGLQFTQ